MCVDIGVCVHTFMQFLLSKHRAPPCTNTLTHNDWWTERDVEVQLLFCSCRTMNRGDHSIISQLRRESKSVKKQSRDVMHRKFNVSSVYALENLINVSFTL